MTTEKRILAAIKNLLEEKVNEYLEGCEFRLPVIDFSSGSGGDYVCPVMKLVTAERTEKDRIIQLDVYTLTLTLSFAFPDRDGERNCYVFAGAAEKALRENHALNGAADWVKMVRKEYKAPRRADTGEGWELVLTLRVTVEEEL
jgi:hypothetical protein